MSRIDVTDRHVTIHVTWTGWIDFPRRLWCGCRRRRCDAYGTGAGLVAECRTCGATISEWDFWPAPLLDEAVRA